MSGGAAPEQRQTADKGTAARGTADAGRGRAATLEVVPARGSRTGKAIVMRKPEPPPPPPVTPAARGTSAAQRAVTYVPPPRPSTELIAAKMIVSLDAGKGSVSGARSALSHMTAADPKLTRDEVMAIWNRLDQKNRLGDFLLISVEPEILKFLVRYEIPWSFILSNWELSVYDTSLFLAGVAAGLAEDFIEGISFIAELAASPFMDNIAGAAEKLGVIDAAKAKKLVADRDAFWDGIGGFLDAISFEAIKQLGKGWFDETVAAFLKLDFYTAGNKFGRLIAILITLPVAWKTAKGAVRGAGKLAKKARALLQRGLKGLSAVDYGALLNLVVSLPELAATRLLELIPLDELQSFLDKLDELIPKGMLAPELAAATATAGRSGNSFALVGDSLLAWSKTGEPIGKQLLSKAREIAGSGAKKAGKAGRAAEVPKSNWLRPKLPPHLAGLSDDAVRWLQKKDLLGKLQKARLAEHELVIVDYIDAFRNVTNFDEVLGDFLSPLKFKRQGAGFHLNFAWSKYNAAKHSDPHFLHKMVFESKEGRWRYAADGTLTKFDRSVDITIGGTRYELKSAKRIYEYFVKGKSKKRFGQLKKDIFDAMGRASTAEEVLQEMQKTVWVFDSANMGLSGIGRADVIAEFQRLLSAEEFLKGHKLMPDIIANLGKSIVFWP